MDVDGTNKRKVTDVLVGFGAGFSADGRFIAAASDGAALVFDVDDLNAAPRRVTMPSPYEATGVTWSPDGSHFVLELERSNRRPHVYTTNVDGTDLWQVTCTEQETAFGARGVPPG